MNQYPLWKYLLVLGVLLVGVLYALPNLYGEDYAVQVSGVRGADMSPALEERVLSTLRAEGVSVKTVHLERDRLLVRVATAEDQLAAADALRSSLEDNYVIALNLAHSTPGWLRALNAEPMVLGLDLQGGVHFLMEVDMDAALRFAQERFVGNIRDLLRDERIRYVSVSRRVDGVQVELRSAEDLERARRVIENEIAELDMAAAGGTGEHRLIGRIRDDYLEEIRSTALEQNLTILRNRVNELGVAEPIIQQQGAERIVVQLPGVQDTAEAKRIIGATATLEYRLVDERNDPFAAQESGRVPAGSRLYRQRDGTPILLDRSVIVSGDQLVDAAASFDQQSGSPAVVVRLNSAGSRRMRNTTQENVGNRMAVVFIERKPETRMVDGEEVRTTRTIEEVINVAVIREPFGARFQTTGLESVEEARTLSLLLRAGALAAPMEIIEERTVGPSLGADNIRTGFMAVMIGFCAVLVFMAVYYRVFGLIANMALFFNLVMIMALLSMLGATLTMPGIAGIVLTVGMAVDANVLIFERIREELDNGNSPQASIRAGYEKAFSSIADANVTTLIAAIVLFTFGTGPIKGFAVTLSLGLATSMFTAIMGTRAVVNLIFGRRRLKTLPV